MMKKFKRVSLMIIVLVVGLVLVACQTPTYTVTFDMQGGTSIDSVTVEKGGTVELISDPTYEGHVFNGWYMDAEGTIEFTSETTVTENITVYAVWTVNQYTVTFNTNGGSVVDDQVVNYGEQVVQPETPTKEGMSFSYWYIDDENTSFDFDMEVTENLTLYAKWSDDEYVLTFDTMGGTSVSSISGSYGTVITEPEQPTKEGYTFGGWYADNTYETVFDFDQTLEQSMTVYAQWIPKQYTITFETAGGSTIEPMTVGYGETIELPDDPTLDGATFAGWYTSQSYYTEYVFSTMPNKNIVVYAKWDMPDEMRVTSDLAQINIPDVITGNLELGKYGEKGTKFSWDFSRPDYISEDGDVVLAPIGSGGMPISITLKASYGSYTETVDYNVIVDEMMDGTVTSVVNYDFISLSEEYITQDSNIDLFFINEGSVPFVDVEEFLPMVDGAIESVLDDEPTEITDEFDEMWNVEKEMEVIPQGEGVLLIRANSLYTPMVYDVDGETRIVDTEREAESYTYELVLDFTNNTLYSETYDFFDSLGAATSTDFGDGLVFGDSTTIEGDAVEISFDEYRIELIEYDNDGEVEYLVPLYLANLLFVGEIYYDVYFNGDALYGVDSYQLLDGEEDVVSTIRTSSANTKSAPLDLKLATYDYLAFVFDYFYGLKEDKGITSFYDEFLPYSEDLLFGRDSSHYNAIFDIVYSLDDLHTYHIMTGYYTEPDYSIDLTSLSQVGEHSANYYQATWDVEDLVAEANRKTLTVTEDNKTAVIAIDEFTVDTPVDFQRNLEIIQTEYPTVENVVVDLSNNGGGNVGAVWRLFGYMTEDSFYYHSMNPLTHSVYNYEISSTYVAYDYNWYILISPVTFSAANLAAAMAKEAGFATIIGLQSSGGASSISGKVLPTGDVFFMSSLNVITVEVEDGYESVEYGVVPDYEYSGLSKLYDYEYLQSFIANIENS